MLSDSFNSDMDFKWVFKWVRSRSPLFTGLQKKKKKKKKSNRKEELFCFQNLLLRSR